MADMSPSLTAYMSEWNVMEREHEARLRHKKTCTGCTWCAEEEAATAARAAPPPAPLSRAALTERWDNSPLVAAAVTGDIEWVKELLAEGADVNEFSPGSWEYSPLIAAAQKGHVEVVRLLLQTGVCDLTKKHMDYINALDSALNGYCNFDGEDDEFIPEIRSMIIRAYMETADRIKEDTLLQIEATGAVAPEYIKVFRTAGGVRIAPKYSVYMKKLPGQTLNLSDPPAAKMSAIITAAKRAADTIAARKAAAVAGAGIAKLKKIAGPAAAPSRLNVCGGAGSSCERYESDDDDDHPMKKKVDAYDPMLDDSYGKMSRRFNF